MYKPEATIRILRKSILYNRRGRIYYGAKGMERRIIRCCDDNQFCPFPDYCFYKYKQFVNATDNPKETKREYKRPQRSVIDTYKTPGLSLSHGDILRC